ncbi:palmitoyl-protein thioesterase [Trichophyton equinum CBS 127.97]|uniref:Palmitoyl-protein thioesterase 1 n=1 Tax=Trichophyton equinum (strain ATCC MYA-4606 / CBS 127.97) TaxID=559882 RepID=F2PKA9_TRIEC|nr:palmitoyl-protein thioesterase [Trichophyton equinum CBS 127.97]
MGGIIISVISSLSILASTVLSSPTQPATGILPLVIWHGLGDSYENDGMKSIARLAETTNPGTHVHLIRFGASGTEDRDATFFGNVTAQVDEVCQTLASDPVIRNAPGINALGFSQGGQFLRAYAQRCNKPPVHNLVTFGSQHNGIASFTACKDSGDWLCWSFNALLRFGTWSSIAQSGLVPAQYFRDPEELEDYLKYSNFLADINNERAVKNPKYRENLMKLNKFVMFMFKDDTTVIPKESAFFTEVNATQRTHVHLIRFGASGTEDRDATFFGNVTAQVDEVCQTLASDPVIRNAPGINALGFSQGGQFLRAYAQRCNKPPVHNLVTFGSQHNGIASFTACKDSGDWLCWSFNALLRFGTWSSIAQSGLVPAQYFRDPEELEDYLKYSNFLADINNERAVKNPKYRENLMKLNKFVMFMFKDDTTVIPKESAFFTEVNATSGEHTKLQDRPMYKEDWLGLKVLDEQSRLEFLTIPGRHMQLSEALLVQSFRRYFGPVEKSGAKDAGTPDFKVQE